MSACVRLSSALPCLSRATKSTSTSSAPDGIGALVWAGSAEDRAARQPNEASSFFTAVSSLLQSERHRFGGGFLALLRHESNLIAAGLQGSQGRGGDILNAAVGIGFGEGRRSGAKLLPILAEDHLQRGLFG